MLLRSPILLSSFLFLVHRPHLLSTGFVFVDVSQLRAKKIFADFCSVNPKDFTKAVDFILPEHELPRKFAVKLALADSQQVGALLLRQPAVFDSLLEMGVIHFWHSFTSCILVDVSQL